MRSLKFKFVLVTGAMRIASVGAAFRGNAVLTEPCRERLLARSLRPSNRRQRSSRRSSTSSSRS
jgi:hypothetical protein